MHQRLIFFLPLYFVESVGSLIPRSSHREIQSAMLAPLFPRQYASWERGLNENTNGLVRQYIPKSRRFDTVTDDEIDFIMYRLNHRPRKTLGYRTPHEVFFNTNTQLTGVALGS